MTLNASLLFILSPQAGCHWMDHQACLRSTYVSSFPHMATLVHATIFSFLEHCLPTDTNGLPLSLFKTGNESMCCLPKNHHVSLLLNSKLKFLHRLYKVMPIHHPHLVLLSASLRTHQSTVAF